MLTIAPLLNRRTFLAATLASLLFLTTLPLASRAASVPETRQPRQSVKVLTIGNSFANDAVSLLPQLAESGGKELILFRANLGGCSLERHARHLKAAIKNSDNREAWPYKNDPVLGLGDKEFVTLIEALSAQKWDFVTIQQVSNQSYKPESYEPHATEIIAAIRKHAPSAEILIHKTWAWREDNTAFKNPNGFSQQVMFDRLSKAYADLAKRHNLRMIPSGDAMQAARKLPRWTYRKDPNYDFDNPPSGQLPDQHGSLNIGYSWKKNKKGEPELRLDTIHANLEGRYLTGCVFYETIYNDSALKLKFVPEGITETDARQLREIAASVTPSR